MKVGRARHVLVAVWMIASVLLFMVLLLQTLLGKYGDDSDVMWQWMFPWLLPTLSLMITVLSVGRKADHEQPVHSRTVFWVAVLLSLVYLGSLWLILLIEPRITISTGTLIKRVTWPLATLQTLVTAAIGKFYIENVRGDPDETPDA